MTQATVSLDGETSTHGSLADGISRCNGDLTGLKWWLNTAEGRREKKGRVHTCHILMDSISQCSVLDIKHYIVKKKKRDLPILK